MINDMDYAIGMFNIAVTAIERTQPGYFAELSARETALGGISDEVEYNLANVILYVGE